MYLEVIHGGRVCVMTREQVKREREEEVNDPDVVVKPVVSTLKGVDEKHSRGVENCHCSNNNSNICSVLNEMGEIG